MPRPSDRPKSQVESHAPGQCLVFWPEAKARTSSTGTTSALAELRVGGPFRKSAPYYSSVSSSLAPKDDPRRPAFMFLVVPIVRILYLARQRLSEAVRERLFPFGQPAHKVVHSFTLSLSAKIRRATLSWAALYVGQVARVALRLSLTAHERAGLDERRIAPNKQVASKRHAEF